MKIEAILCNFIQELYVKTGIKEGVVKIAVTPKLMDTIVYECLAKNKNYITSSRVGEFFICGVQLVAREKDSF